MRTQELSGTTALVTGTTYGLIHNALKNTESRVAALERYAATLKAADAAEHDMERALRVSGQNESYHDLVARTVADEHAIAQITDLTEQAAIPEKAYLESLHQAGLAAEVLVLPADTPEN